MAMVRGVLKTLGNRPGTYDDCIAYARKKFNSYYRNGILQLLNVFPLEHMVDGQPFWDKKTKRPPTPLEFDPQDELHLGKSHFLTC